MRCDPTACTSASTSRRRATSRTTSTTRWGRSIYTISTMHCMTVSLALDGAGLGAAWGEQTAHAMLADAGFTNVNVEHVEGDIFNVYYVAQKD